MTFAFRRVRRDSVRLVAILLLRPAEAIESQAVGIRPRAHGMGDSNALLRTAEATRESPAVGIRPRTFAARTR